MASIHQRPRKDGSIAYRVSYRIDGRQAQDSFDDPVSAERFADRVERIGGRAARAMLLEGEAAPAQVPTLAEWLEEYLDPDSGLLTGVTDGTRDGYRKAAKLSFLDRLGDLPVSEVTPEHVKAWLNWQSQAPSSRRKGERVSAKTIKNYHAILSAVLRAAAHQGVAPSNVAHGLALPESRKRAMVCLTEAEFAKLYNSTGEHYKPLTLALAATGMRFGEATALTWGDLTEGEGGWHFSIDKAWKRGPNGSSYLGHPKSEAGTRIVSIGENVLEALGPRGANRQLIFRNRAGNRVLVSAFGKFGITKAIEKSGITKTPRIHDLRHSHASWLIARNVPLPYIQRRLGHEKIDTTVSVYGHLLPEALSATRDAATEAIKKALG